MSGEFASFGMGAKNGTQMAYEGLSPEETARIELVFEDDQFKPAQTISAYKKLTSQSKVHAIATFGSGTSKAIASLAEAAHIPLIAVATDPEISRNRKFVFNFWVTPEEETKVVIPEAIRRGYKKIAIIATQHDGALSMREHFLKGNAGKFEIVLNQEYAHAERDFRSYIAKLKQKQFDAVLNLLLPGQTGLFAKQARELGVTQPFFSYEVMEDDQEIKISNGGLVGSWFATAKDKSKEFADLYAKKFPNSPNFAADNAYDVVKLFAEATKTSTENEQVAKFFRELKDYHGMGGVFSATGDQRFNLPAGIKVITKEGIVPLN